MPGGSASTRATRVRGQVPIGRWFSRLTASLVGMVIVIESDSLTVLSEPLRACLIAFMARVSVLSGFTRWCGSRYPERL